LVTVLSPLSLVGIVAGARELFTPLNAFFTSLPQSSADAERRDPAAPATLASAPAPRSRKGAASSKPAPPGCLSTYRAAELPPSTLWLGEAAGARPNQLRRPLRRRPRSQPVAAPDAAQARCRFLQLRCCPRGWLGSRESGRAR